MPEKPIASNSAPRRKWVSLATTFVVLSLPGILAFFLPFSITLIGLIDSALLVINRKPF